MAPRSSWKGYLKLSLVSVPVKAFTAHDTSEEIHLNQLHAACNSRVRYLKVCPEHGELKSDEIVSGYEYGKDQYVIIEPDEIKQLRTQSDKSINIDGFVEPEKIDPIYHAGKNYYLVPDGVAGKKPFALLHRGMVEKGLCAIAQIVLSGRQQLVMVRPLDDLLVMAVLSYAKKVKSLDDFTDMVDDQKISAAEMTLANTLVDASTIEEFDLAGYQDVYVEKMTALIEAKVEGEQVVLAPDPEEPQILNLMDALKKSVAEAQAAGTERKKSDKKMAPSAGTKKKAARRRKSG